MPQQVRHVIKSKNSDFRYHFLKGIMLSNSKISGRTHPIKEVNDFRKHLFDNQKLAKDGDDFILKDNISTGLLMAYNLYSGELKTDLSDLDNSVTLFKFQPEVKDIFKGEIVSTGNRTFKQLNRNCLKLHSIWRFSLDYDFIKGTRQDEFSKYEIFVAELLSKHGYLSNCFRHGDANEKECDVVDEEQGIQVEITFAFKTELDDPKKSPLYASERILTEFTNNRFIHPSKSLLNKMSKEYTSNYKKYLAMLMIGSPESGLTLFEKLLDFLDKKGITISPFREYFIITFDPINDIFTILSFKDKKIIHDKETTGFGFIKKERIDFSQIEDGEKCLYLLDNLFTDEKPIMMLGVDEFNSFANELKIFDFSK